MQSLKLNIFLVQLLFLHINICLTFLLKSLICLSQFDKENYLDKNQTKYKPMLSTDVHCLKR